MKLLLGSRQGLWGWSRHAVRFLKHYLVASVRHNRRAPRESPAISVENTSVCNSRCVFCPNGSMQRNRQQMKLDVFKKAVDEAAQIGCTDIDFFVTIGDPLLDPHLLERARYVKQVSRVSSMGFNTTLQWLHLFTLDEFFACGFTWISVSTTLSGPETYRDFFGVDKYSQMLTNLTDLLKENKRRGSPIDVLIGIKPTPERRADILNHPDFKLVQSLTAQDLADEVRREDFFVCDWGGAVRLPSYLRPLPLWPRAHRPCYRLYEGLMLFSNGKVGACACRDFEASSELILGSIQEDSLDKMWNGDKLKQIRSDWLTGKSIPDVCQKCRSYDPRAFVKL